MTCPTFGLALFKKKKKKISKGEGEEKSVKNISKVLFPQTGSFVPLVHFCPGSAYFVYRESVCLQRVNFTSPKAPFCVFLKELKLTLTQLCPPQFLGKFVPGHHAR